MTIVARQISFPTRFLGVPLLTNFGPICVCMYVYINIYIYIYIYRKKERRVVILLPTISENKLI